ncbi:hypothetical protein [Streptomyces sp. PSKA01]|uniref:Uncharacterized protein n=1 Tax=Streptomyces cupreus TaxID=2759956 RepID=A0A7X1J509_9ACTN|nr:hypothetical protein [Streptomyces cupreus]
MLGPKYTADMPRPPSTGRATPTTKPDPGVHSRRTAWTILRDTEAVDGLVGFGLGADELSLGDHVADRVADAPAEHDNVRIHTGN